LERTVLGQGLILLNTNPFHKTQEHMQSHPHINFKFTVYKITLPTAWM